MPKSAFTSTGRSGVAEVPGDSICDMDYAVYDIHRHCGQGSTGSRAVNAQTVAATKHGTMMHAHHIARTRQQKPRPMRIERQSEVRAEVDEGSNHIAGAQQ